MALDERLRRELERAARPADPAGVYEELIRRKERRSIVRKAQRVALACVVVGGSIAGVLVLSRVFRGADDDRPALPSEPRGSITYVVYEGQPGDRDVTSTITVARPDGSEARPIYSMEGTITSLEWAPTGDRLAFDVLGHDQDSGGTYVLDLATSRTERIADLSSTGITWSPGGEKIAFTDSLRGANVLFIANPDGSDRQQVTSETVSVAMPDWSPDGTRIALAGEPAQVEVDVWDIFVVDLESGELTQLTNDPTFDLDPDWSPDGSRIAFRSRRDIVVGAESDEPDEIYVMNADGSDQTRLTFDLARDQFPTWSPDGTAIVFSSFGPDSDPSETEIVVIDADGSDRRTIVTGTEVGTAVTWSLALADGEPIPSGSPSQTPSPADDRITDVGLGLQICDVDTVTGSFVEGTPQTAFVGIELTRDGRCPTSQELTGIAVIDVSGDGEADVASEPFDCDFTCGAYAAPDVDGDGTDELLVLNVGFSVSGVALFDVVTDGDIVSLVRAMVEPPGDATFGVEGFDGSGPPQFWIGGDGFTADSLRCEASPSGRVLISTTAQIVPPDSPDSVWEVHETRFVLDDGVLRVVGASDFTEPVDPGTTAPSFTGTGGCGADLGGP